ncbi:MAG TPA: hypothetical protein VK369_13900 [Segetibacter sp.]|jgi:hypothetical protein|nr:hypothetical protein [Segetibacter sp.]
MVSGEFKCKQYAIAKRMRPGKDSTFELILQRETLKQHGWNAKLLPLKFARIIACLSCSTNGNSTGYIRLKWTEFKTTGFQKHMTGN